MVTLTGSVALVGSSLGTNPPGKEAGPADSLHALLRRGFECTQDEMLQWRRSSKSSQHCAGDPHALLAELALPWPNFPEPPPCDWQQPVYPRERQVQGNAPLSGVQDVDAVPERLTQQAAVPALALSTQLFRKSLQRPELTDEEKQAARQTRKRARDKATRERRKLAKLQDRSSLG